MGNSMNKNIDNTRMTKIEEIVLLIIAFAGLLTLVIYWR